MPTRDRPPPQPPGWLHLLGLIAVLAVFGAYLVHWLQANWPMLTNPDLQNDDARTVLFPFHRYGPEGVLGDDPIANEMLSLVPIGPWLLYRILVPIADLFVAAKLVQLCALLIAVVAAAVLARSPRGGLGAGLFLLFLVLHDWFAINRIAGGLPRAFAFPCFALWAAGVLGANRAARAAAPVIAALTYPPAMNMILAAEGLYALRAVGTGNWAVLRRRLQRYALLVGLCVVIVLPSAIGDRERGPIHTLAQAKQEPAFGKAGRLWLLPFDPPEEVFAAAFVDVFSPRGVRLFAGFYAGKWRDHAPAMALAIITLLALLPILRLSPAPTIVVCFIAGCIILYALSRIFAFQLYSPERYYRFGMHMAATLFAAATLGQILYRLPAGWRYPLRNLVLAAAMLALWGVLGDGVRPMNGMTIDANRNRPLLDYVRSLPADIRVACHPRDCDDLPLFARRANAGAFETMTPWFVEVWRRQRQRFEDTLDALYATDVPTVQRFAEQYGVTHFLLRRSRYDGDLTAESASLEPFTSYAAKILRGTRPQDLVFAHVPPQAVTFRHGDIMIVEVARLGDAATARPAAKPDS